MYTPDQRRTLLMIGRRAVETYLTSGVAPSSSPQTLPQDPVLMEPRGVFATWHAAAGDLRG